MRLGKVDLAFSITLTTDVAEDWCDPSSSCEKASLIVKEWRDCTLSMVID